MRRSRLVRARNALYTLFFVNGAVLATWVVHIPTVQRNLELGEGTLGLVLLSLAGGALLMMPSTGLLVVRVGSRRVLAVANATLCLTLPFVLLAPSPLWAAFTLFILGLSNGAVEVAMNTHAVAVERAWRGPIMSSFHALWSVGGLVGAGVGALAFTLGLAPFTHVLLVAGLLALLGSSRAPGLLDPSYETREGRPTFALPRGPLVGLGLLAFAGLVAEGAVANWGTVYLSTSLGTSAGLAAAGYATFQGAMVAGRFFGDALKRWVTEEALARLSAGLATFGFGSAFLSGSLAASLMGFGFIGLGLSNLVPIFLAPLAGLPVSVQAWPSQRSQPRATWVTLWGLPLSAWPLS